MRISVIIALALCFCAIRLLPNDRLRKNSLIALSILFLFYMQPLTPIRNLDFWFPLSTIGLTCACWMSFVDREKLSWRETRQTIFVIFLTIAVIESTRFFSFDGIATFSRPPTVISACTFLLTISGFFLLSWFAGKTARKSVLSFWISIILLALTTLKLPIGALKASELLRSFSGQAANLASAQDLRWMGFSYIAFRLLSVLIDARKGRKLYLSLRDFLIYVIFPPTLAAGPIDRADRFCKDMAQISTDREMVESDWLTALERIFRGLFRKFILADSLALISLSANNYWQIQSSDWAWLALFLYGLQIYFDFAGYSDIAIGIARIIGIKLPENFNRPYSKPDISKFWNYWHITLTSWIRSYVFNPLTRRMRSQKNRPLPPLAVVFLSQMITMLLIGAWHGITLNFVIWGAWHGLGLFFHQAYSRFSSGFLADWETSKPGLKRSYTIVSTGLTIAFVMLGWVWFAIPTFSGALSFFSVLF